MNLKLCFWFLFCAINQSLSQGTIFDGLLNRVQKTWMTSWQKMRDQQIRPRMFADLRLNQTPTYVQSLEGNRGQVDLAVSVFDPSRSDVSLSRIRNVGKWLQNFENLEMEVVGHGLGWPNAVGKVDNELLPDSETVYWWMTSTYFTEQNADGQISLIPIVDNNTTASSRRPIVVSQNEGENKWYYSLVEWVDMNKDGWPDIVTSRSHGIPGAIQYTELVWFENPGYRFAWNSHEAWISHPITQGPDVSFRVMTIPLPSGESRLVIIGAGYWDNKLYAVWSDDPRENWENVDAINERVIDNHGWFFDLQIADVNADGRDDIVVSTWIYRLKQGSVLVYEIPCDFIHGQWRRHVLIDGTLDLPVPDRGSGGKINIFHPHVRYGRISSKKKPFVLVSGDDDGRVYVLIPNSRKTSDWAYTSHTIFKTRGPVGSSTVDDLDHDGYMEIVIPVIDSRRLAFFTYEPAAIGPEYFVDETRIDGQV